MIGFSVYALEWEGILVDRLSSQFMFDVEVRRTPRSPDWQRAARFTENTLPTLLSALVHRLPDRGQSAIGRERTLRPTRATV